MHKQGEKSKGTSKKQKPREEIKQKATEILQKAGSFTRSLPTKLLRFIHPEVSEEDAELEAYMSRFEKCKKGVQESHDKLIKAGSLSWSWDSIKEFTDSLRDIDGVWVGYILKLKVDILDSKPARDLVHVYFGVSVQTLEVLNELEDCLRVAGNDQLTLRLAANKFVNKKCPETLEKMEKFKAKEDPFKKFWPLYFKLCQQQISSLDKVMDLHVLLNKLAKSKEEHQEADGDDVVAPMEELELNCVLTEFENYRALALTLTEKITSLSAETAIDDDEAKLVVDNLNTEIDKFRDDIANMTDHTRECRNDIFSGRDRVSDRTNTSV